MLEQGLPAVGLCKPSQTSLADFTSHFQSSSTLFLMMKALSSETGTQIASDGVCHIPNHNLQLEV